MTLDGSPVHLPAVSFPTQTRADGAKRTRAAGVCTPPSTYSEEVVHANQRFGFRRNTFASAAEPSFVSTCLFRLRDEKLLRPAFFLLRAALNSTHAGPFRLFVHSSRTDPRGQNPTRKRASSLKTGRSSRAAIQPRISVLPDQKKKKKADPR